MMDLSKEELSKADLYVLYHAGVITQEEYVHAIINKEIHRGE